jgi:hypothetical protein
VPAVIDHDTSTADASNLPEQVMANSTFSFALIGVVPAVCDAEAGEANRLSTDAALSEMPGGRRARAAELQLLPRSTKRLVVAGCLPRALAKVTSLPFTRPARYSDSAGTDSADHASS